MRNWKIYGVGAAVALLVAGVSVLGARALKANADGAPGQSADVAAIPAAPATGHGDHLSASTEASVLDTNAAMTVARQTLTPGFIASATSITINKYRFTSDEVATSVVPKNVLAWVVTFNGVSVPEWGDPVNRAPADAAAPSRVAHQLNLVIDANTGTCLMAWNGLVSNQ